MKRILNLSSLVLFIFSTHLYAQTGPLVPNPRPLPPRPIPDPIRPSPRPTPSPIPTIVPRPPDDIVRDVPKASLGSHAEVFKLYSKDLRSIVQRSMPSYDSQLLTNHFTRIHHENPNGILGPVLDPKVLQSLMLMDGIKEGEGETKDGGYHLNPRIGRAVITRDLFKPEALMHKEDGLRLLPQVQSIHHEALNRIKLDHSQVYSSNTILRMMDVSKDKGQGQLESEGPAKVEGYLTYGTRSIRGIFVEGSNFKIYSHDNKQLAGISVRWPVVRFHPEIKNFALKEKSAVQEEIYQHALKTMNKNHEYNMKMAVVLQPVKYQNQEFFIPVLKVGMLSRPPGGGVKAEMMGEAGEEYFVSLVKAPLQYEPANDIDRN